LRCCITSASNFRKTSSSSVRFNDFRTARRSSAVSNVLKGRYAQALCPQVSATINQLSLWFSLRFHPNFTISTSLPKYIVRAYARTYSTHSTILSFFPFLSVFIRITGFNVQLPGWYSFMYAGVVLRQAICRYCFACINALISDIQHSRSSSVILCSRCGLLGLLWISKVRSPVLT